MPRKQANDNIGPSEIPNRVQEFDISEYLKSGGGGGDMFDWIVKTEGRLSSLETKIDNVEKKIDKLPTHLGNALTFLTVLGIIVALIVGLKELQII